LTSLPCYPVKTATGHNGDSQNGDNNKSKWRQSMSVIANRIIGHYSVQSYKSATVQVNYSVYCKLLQ